MNKEEDEYTALENYFQLVGEEIEQTIDASGKRKTQNTPIDAQTISTKTSAREDLSNKNDPSKNATPAPRDDRSAGTVDTTESRRSLPSGSRPKVRNSNSEHLTSSRNDPNGHSGRSYRQTYRDEELERAEDEVFASLALRMHDDTDRSSKRHVRVDDRPHAKSDENSVSSHDFRRHERKKREGQVEENRSHKPVSGLPVPINSPTVRRNEYVKALPRRWRSLGHDDSEHMKSGRRMTDQQAAPAIPPRSSSLPSKKLDGSNKTIQKDTDLTSKGNSGWQRGVTCDVKMKTSSQKTGRKREGNCPSNFEARRDVIRFGIGLESNLSAEAYRKAIGSDKLQYKQKYQDNVNKKEASSGTLLPSTLPNASQPPEFEAEIDKDEFLERVIKTESRKDKAVHSHKKLATGSQMQEKILGNKADLHRLLDTDRDRLIHGMEFKSRGVETQPASDHERLIRKTSEKRSKAEDYKMHDFKKASEQIKINPCPTDYPKLGRSSNKSEPLTMPTEAKEIKSKLPELKFSEDGHSRRRSSTGIIETHSAHGKPHNLQRQLRHVHHCYHPRHHHRHGHSHSQEEDTHHYHHHRHHSERLHNHHDNNKRAAFLARDHQNLSATRKSDDDRNRARDIITKHNYDKDYELRAEHHHHLRQRQGDNSIEAPTSKKPIRYKLVSDPLADLKKKKRAELLAQIYEDVKKVTRQPPLEYSTPSPERRKPTPSFSNPIYSRSRGFSESDLTELLDCEESLNTDPSSFRISDSCMLESQLFRGEYEADGDEKITEQPILSPPKGFGNDSDISSMTSSMETSMETSQEIVEVRVVESEREHSVTPPPLPPKRKLADPSTLSPSLKTESVSTFKSEIPIKQNENRKDGSTISNNKESKGLNIAPIPRHGIAAENISSTGSLAVSCRTTEFGRNEEANPRHGVAVSETTSTSQSAQGPGSALSTGEDSEEAEKARMVLKKRTGIGVSPADENSNHVDLPDLVIDESEYTTHVQQSQSFKEHSNTQHNLPQDLYIQDEQANLESTKSVLENLQDDSNNNVVDPSLCLASDRTHDKQQHGFSTGFRNGYGDPWDDKVFSQHQRNDDAFNADFRSLHNGDNSYFKLPGPNLSFTQNTAPGLQRKQVEVDSRHEMSSGPSRNEASAFKSNESSAYRAHLKDTAVQTSLDLDGYVLDVADSLSEHEGQKPSIKAKFISEPVELDRADNSALSKESHDSLQLSNSISNSHQHVLHEGTAPSSHGGNKKRKLHRSNKAAISRSKSLHTEGHVDEGKLLRPEISSLSGSLRELSHLNIDVSQRLVDGERQYVVNNGSPEMQVMVNALTPVLSRRNRSSRGTKGMRGVHQTSGPSSPEVYKQQGDSNLHEDEVFHKDPSRAERISDKYSNGQSQHTETTNLVKTDDERVFFNNENVLPMYARLRSHDGSYQLKSPKQVKSPTDNLKKKQLYRISDKLSKLSQSVAANEDHETSGANTTDDWKQLCLDLALDDASLSEELETNKKSLILNPKLAHTWHGPSQGASPRLAPKMGVGVMRGDTTKLFSGPPAVDPGVTKPPSPYPPHTLPVICRTLLDAMHKRYCAHQYSHQYTTLKPFSMLKLDPTSAARSHPITALRVEPRHIRDHKVIEAPPSPQLLARLQKLVSEGESDALSSATDSVQSSPRQPHEDSAQKQCLPQPLGSEPSLEGPQRQRRHSSASHTHESSQSPPLNGSATHLEQVGSLSQPRLHFRRASAHEFSSSNESSPYPHDSLEDSPLLTARGHHRTPQTSSTPDSSPSLRERLSHGHRHQAELEAVEGIKWLRAAGFPQYAQMFEDGQFPVDLSTVERDHDFLDKDSLQSLFRRLETLNKFAGMKIDANSRKKATSEDDDEDDLCALSERWEYQKSVRRWSRKDNNRQLSPDSQTGGQLVRTGSHDSLLADQDSGSQTGDSPLLHSKMPHRSDSADIEGRDKMTDLGQGEGQQPGFPISPRLRRVASERIKTAKNLWKKMEVGFKPKKSRRSNQRSQAVDISGPVLTDTENMQARLQRLQCVDISPTNEEAPKIALMPDGRPAGVARITSLESSSSPAMSPTSPDSNSSLPSPVPSQGASSKSSSSSPTGDVKSHHQADVSFSSTTTSSSSSSTASTQPEMRSHFSSSIQSHRDQTAAPIPRSTHDSRLGEYYSAQSELQQTLHGVTRGNTSVPRNNSDTNLMEIFLLPQDHQPGRFPRLLQNGYIETEQSGVAVNSRTGSLRFGKDTGALSEHHRLASNQSPSIPRLVSNRVSVYDNFGPTDGTPSVIPGIIELRPPRGASNSDTYDSKGRSVSFGSYDKDSKYSRSSASSEPRGAMSSGVRDRSVSFESSSSRTVGHSNSESPDRDASVISDSRFHDRISSSSGSGSSNSLTVRGVVHSASADSYFRDSASAGDRSSRTSTITSDSNTSSSTLQQDFDEVEMFMKQLFENINDLARGAGSDDTESHFPSFPTSLDPTPTPSSQTFPTSATTSTDSPLYVSTTSSSPRPSRSRSPRDLPASLARHIRPVQDLDSPSSPTSDLVLSPTSPLSQPSLVTDESIMDVDGGANTDDPENSSSGGEGSSHTAESISDQEVALTDISHDDSLDQFTEVSRERRDSGVGHSLTRAPCEGPRKKIRWHSFQRCHRPDVSSRAMQINCLTIGQLVRLQKLSLLKLTGIMEKCLPVNKSGWNWMMPRFMKRNKSPDFSDKNVFGVPLSVMAQRTGQPLPQCVLYAMRYLRRTSQNAVGIFRKSGVKSKIQQLRDHLEAHPDTTDFEGVNAYNVADMIKTYFRDLPECLLTSKLSETFRSIYAHVPEAQRLEAIQAAILLLPDESREVLQSILLFLSDIATHEKEHQMNASNLAVCFTPTVFMLGSRQLSTHSPKRNRKNSSGIPDPREIMEQKASQECLTMMITESKKLFSVPSQMFRQLQVPSLAHMELTPFQNLNGEDPITAVKTFGQEKIQLVLKKAHDKNRGWMGTTTIGDVEVNYRKPNDNCHLKEWKFVVDIEAPPVEVLNRLKHERHAWDEDLLSWSVVERLDVDHSDIFQYVLNSMAPHPCRHFCVLRYWRSDLKRGACALISMSVEHPDVTEVQGVMAEDLGSAYLMEPCGSGRSRLTFVTRVDTRGRTPEWYSKIFGHITANFLERLRESFKQETSGPETKV